MCDGASPLCVTEHRRYVFTCGQCQTRTRAAWPTGVPGPVPYGPRLSALVVYLQLGQFLPDARCLQLRRDLYGVTLAKGTVTAMVRRAAVRVQDFGTALRQQVSAAPVKHLDETGPRVARRQAWLHVISTAEGAHLRRARRGDVGTDLTGCVVHDRWAAYFTLDGGGWTHVLTTCVTWRPWWSMMANRGRRRCSTCCAAPCRSRS